MKRFLGFVTYLAKFIPKLSEEHQPLRALLKADSDFRWEAEQQASFNKLKDLCSTAPIYTLAYYDVRKPVEIQCDASSMGLGAVLLQDSKPIAYASRSLTDTEVRHAQIEKEMLSIVYACSKFHHYIFGKHVHVFNDHKPLESIHKKPLLSAPMRLQRMLLKLQWYDLTITYRKGKDMQLADTLSRAYCQSTDKESDEFEYINALSHISITSEKKSEFQTSTERELKELYDTILKGWPEHREQTLTAVRPYWDSRDQLSVSDGITWYTASRSQSAQLCSREEQEDEPKV